jgi:hypothetical protein
MTSETCQICGKTKNVNAAGHCQGHDNPTSSKQNLDAIRGASGRAPVMTEAPAPGLSLKEQLDAIPAPAAAGGPPAAPAASAPAAAAAPPLGTAGAKKGPGAILGRKTGAGTDDISALKNQLDAIPAPGSGASPQTVVPKDLLDSIPTPGSGGGAARPEATVSKSALDAIPAPGERPAAPAAAAPISGASLAEQLNSIPTPSVVAAPGGGDKPAGEVPEWMRNFEKHQSAISASIATPGGQQPAGFGGGGYGGAAPDGYTPDAVAPSYGSSRGGEAPPQGSTYNMIIGVVIIICLAMFGYLMISKPAPPVMPDGSTPTTSTPVSTPVPTSTPVTTPPVVPSGSVPGAAPGAYTPPASGVPVPGATPTMPVQGATPTMPVAVPTPDPNAGAQQGNNPIAPTGNNP